MSLFFLNLISLYHAISAIHRPSKASAASTESATEASTKSTVITSAEATSPRLSCSKIWENVIVIVTAERWVASKATKTTKASKSSIRVEDASIWTNQISWYATSSRTANSQRIIITYDVSRSLAISEKWIAKVWSNASLTEAWSTALRSRLWFVKIIWK